MLHVSLLLATALAGFIYVIAPGPAFLALFTLGAARGRGSGAWFMAGHLVGDIAWSILAFAAIVGASQIGSTVFDLLGIACGLYLIYMGFKALTARRNRENAVIGAERPLLNGVIFGLTNPKSYPVALATYGALVSPHADAIAWTDTPALILSALAGFLAAYLVLYVSIGLPPVRRFFSRHGIWVTHVVGAIFIGFGAKSLFDGARGLAGSPR